MPYCFRRDDASLETGLRRIAQAQLGDALDALGEPATPLPERVRRSRRALRRIASLLRLVGEALPRHREEAGALEDAAALLDGLKDVSTHLAVVRRHEPFLAETIGPDWAAALLARLTETAAERESGAVANGQLIRFRVALLSAWERAGSWCLSAENRDALTPGLEESYAAARTAMRTALSGNRAAFAPWRLAAMTHRDHARLLRQTVPGPMEAHLTMAEVLCEALGDHRDLGLLGDGGFFGWLEREGLAEETSIAARRRFADLRREIETPALALGTALFAEPPEGLACRFATYWEVCRGGALASRAPDVAPKAIAAL